MSKVSSAYKNSKRTNGGLEICRFPFYLLVKPLCSAGRCGQSWVVLLTMSLFAEKRCVCLRLFTTLWHSALLEARTELAQLKHSYLLSMYMFYTGSTHCD